MLGPNRTRFTSATLGPKTGSGSSYTPFKSPALWIQPPRIYFVPTGTYQLHPPFIVIFNESSHRTDKYIFGGFLQLGRVL